jgi:hypothetical protein
MMNSSDISDSSKLYNAPGEVYMVSNESTTHPVITPIGISRTERTWTISHLAN